MVPTERMKNRLRKVMDDKFGPGSEVVISDDDLATALTYVLTGVLHGPEAPAGFTWIDQPVRVRGEDFTYDATLLCSFPKTSGKVRYVVEDNGRIFIQRKEQLSHVSKNALVQSASLDIKPDVQFCEKHGTFPAETCP